MSLSEMEYKKAVLVDVDLKKSVADETQSEILLAGQYEIIEYSDMFNDGLGNNSREFLETGVHSKRVYENNSNIRKLGMYQLSLNDLTVANNTEKAFISNQKNLENELDNVTQLMHEDGLSVIGDRHDLERRCRRFQDDLDAQGENKMFNCHAQQQIQNLLNYQEKLTNKYEDLERRSKCIRKDLEIERQSKQHAEQKFRSEIEELTAKVQDKSSRTQKLIKEIAELKPADPYRRGDEYFKLKIEALQYQIKNWCRNQELEFSHHPQFGVRGFVCSKLGQHKAGPNYDFLKMISVDWAGYTLSSQGFKLILQAYIWKTLIKLIFETDQWASTSVRLDWTDTEFEIPASYGSLKTRLQPGIDCTKEYIERFHFWRSTTARLLTGRISPSRISATIGTIREAVVRPIINGAQPNVPDLHLQELDSIIEAALKLGTDMAHQRAHFEFEFVPLEDYGKTFVLPGLMYSCQGGFVEAGHANVVQLTLAPRVLRWGSQEGTCFDACKQIVMMEIQTRTVQNVPITETKTQRIWQF